MVSTLSLSSVINQIFQVLLCKFPICKFATLFPQYKHTEINFRAFAFLAKSKKVSVFVSTHFSCKLMYYYQCVGVYTYLSYNIYFCQTRRHNDSAVLYFTELHSFSSIILIAD